MTWALRAADMIQVKGGAGYKSSDGSFYLSGRTDISGDDDPLLIKINSDGTKNFVRQYRIANSSNEYISYGRLTADGGYLLYGNTDYNNAGDILVLKINATGGISWARELQISGATFISPSRFYELSSGGYVLTGSVSGVGAGSSDAYAIKISADGNTVNFAKAYGTSRTENSYGITEHSSGKISFVGDRNVLSNGTDGWWVELNSDGSLNYSKSIGGTNNEIFKDVLETTSNTYMIVGQWCSTGGTCTGFPCSGFLFEVNTSGSQLLRRIFYTSNPSGKVFAPSCIYRTFRGLAKCGVKKHFAVCWNKDN